MEEEKVFDVYSELQDGYQVQLMVLKVHPNEGRGKLADFFRSRIWIGRASVSEPLAHRSQEHPALPAAIDACYSMLLTSSRTVVTSPGALEAIQQMVHSYFSGVTQSV